MHMVSSHNISQVFCKQHSTVTAAVKVVNDIIEALNGQKYCAALFIDLSKAFDTDETIMASWQTDPTRLDYLTRLLTGSLIIYQTEHSVSKLLGLFPLSSLF